LQICCLCSSDSRRKAGCLFSEWKYAFLFIFYIKFKTKRSFAFVQAYKKNLSFVSNIVINTDSPRQLEDRLSMKLLELVSHLDKFDRLLPNAEMNRMTQYSYEILQLKTILSQATILFLIDNWRSGNLKREVWKRLHPTVTHRNITRVWNLADI